MTARIVLITTGLLLAPVAAMAHPHVYIDAAVEPDFDEQGRLVGVAVEWSYDELYSLLIITDYGLDDDGDGVLTSEENQIIQGFDADWPEGSAGGLYLSLNGAPVALAAPTGFTAEYRDGRLISRHRREVADAIAGDFDLLIQVYDPEFYVDFTVPAAPGPLERNDCTAQLQPGEAGASANAYRAAIDRLLGSGTDMAEADMVTVDIGAAGADQIRLTCGAS